MSIMSSLSIVNMQVFKCSIRSLTHHNKMVLLRERTNHWRRWKPVWWRLRLCHQSFGPEAINYTSYIHNRVPHKDIYGVTPFKYWSGHKPDMTHFRIFGSKAWARIPTEKRKDLKPQSQECLFVGYSKDSKGYKLINLRTNKYFIEISVQFEEEPLAAVEDGESSSPTTIDCKWRD